MFMLLFCVGLFETRDPLNHSPPFSIMDWMKASRHAYIHGPLSYLNGPCMSPVFCLYYDCFSPQGDCVQVSRGWMKDTHRLYKYRTHVRWWCTFERTRPVFSLEIVYRDEYIFKGTVAWERARFRSFSALGEFAKLNFSVRQAKN